MVRAIKWVDEVKFCLYDSSTFSKCAFISMKLGHKR